MQHILKGRVAEVRKTHLVLHFYLLIFLCCFYAFGRYNLLYKILIYKHKFNAFSCKQWRLSRSFSDAPAGLWSCSWSCRAPGEQAGRSRGGKSPACIGTELQDNPHRWSGCRAWSNRPQRNYLEHLEEQRQKREEVLQSVLGLKGKLASMIKGEIDK